MNKTFIALLLVAAVGGSLYFFSDRFGCNQQSHLPGIKERIIAAWKTDSVYRVKMDTIQDIDQIGCFKDSVPVKPVLSFTKPGKLVCMINDSVSPAGSQDIVWKTDSVFVWKADSADVTISVKKLTAGSLQLETGTHEKIWLHKLLEK